MFKFTKIELVLVVVIILVTVLGIRSCQNRNQMRIGTVETVGANSVEAVQQTETTPVPVARETNVAKTATNRVTVEFSFDPEIK